MRTSSIVANTAEAWRKYVSVGAIASDLLRPHVLQAWLRSHDQGASPWVARAEGLSRAETERTLTRHARLLSATRPYLNLLSRAAGDERHAVMLGTAEAIILDVIGDQQSVSGPERVPGPGALLTEATCGSNGIGTPLVAGRYVEIISTEHFIHGFHAFTCHGIPIDTSDGARAGVLSVSVRQPETAERLHEILVCAAYGIAAELLRLQLADAVHAAMTTGSPVSIATLRAELGRLGIAPPEVSRGTAESADESALREMLGVIRVASEVIRELELRERAWRELSSDELEIPSPIELMDELSGIIELLTPEVKRRRVQVIYGSNSEPLTGLADRRTLRRDIFRLLLRGLGTAEGGGAVIVDIEKDQTGRLCRTTIEAVPGPEGSGERMVSSVTCPRAPRFH
jgi:hypothetical protein